MNLQEAIHFTRSNRDSWRDGKGAGTARINSDHVIRILGADLPIEGIATKHFTELTRKLKEEGKAPATVNRCTAALSTVLSELRQNGIDAPRVEYKRQKESKGRPEFYTEEEIALLLEESKHEGDYMLLHDSILFAVKTGCRQGELLKLTFDNVDLEERSITFVDVKTDGDHVIHMHPDLVEVIERRKVYAINNEVFQWRDKDQLLRALRALQKRCGIDKNKCWHTFRHTTATWLLERNVPIRAVMGVLGHANINTTLRYGKFTDRSIAAAIELI